MKNLNLSSV